MDLTNIDPAVATSLVQLGAELTTLLFKGTTTAIQGKIASLKNEKNIDVLRSSYTEMLNQLAGEREEALMIAQTYKIELERVVISDEDIEYLQMTVAKVIDLLVGMNIFNDAEIKSMQSIKDLISKDVLKTMQLLGFNYKAAIGEPLTKLCANKIEGLSKNKIKKKK